MMFPLLCTGVECGIRDDCARHKVKPGRESRFVRPEYQDGRCVYKLPASQVAAVLAAQPQDGGRGGCRFC